jgi:hypothetical protein
MRKYRFSRLSNTLIEHRARASGNIPSRAYLHALSKETSASAQMRKRADVITLRSMKCKQDQLDPSSTKGIKQRTELV